MVNKILYACILISCTTSCTTIAVIQDNSLQHSEICSCYGIDYKKYQSSIDPEMNYAEDLFEAFGHLPHCPKLDYTSTEKYSCCPLYENVLTK
jgi:hypothetical protein